MAEALDEEGLIGGNFDQIRVYDAPAVALTQIMDGEASWRSFRDTLLDPSALSPAERDSFTGRIKESLGNNPLGNALVDIATNPFVILMFVTSPAAGAALKSTGRVFTGLGKEVGGRGPEYMQYVLGNYSPIRMAGLLNAHQYGAGTPLTSVMHEVTSRLDDLTSKDTLAIRQSTVDLLKKISVKFGANVDSLDPSKAPSAFAEVDGQMTSLQEYLKKLNVFAYAHMSGMTKQVKKAQATLSQINLLEVKSGNKITQVELDRSQAARISDLLSKRAAATSMENVKEAKKFDNDIRAYLVRLKKKIPLGADIQGVRTSETTKGFIPMGKDKEGLKVMTKEVLSYPLDPQALTSKWLEREGVLPLLAQSRSMMKERYAEMFLKGGSEALAKGKVVYDENKLSRIFHAMSDAAKNNNYHASEFLVREVFGGVDEGLRRKLLKAFEDGTITRDGFRKMLTEVRSKDDIENFMSRNVWSFIYTDGKKLRVDASNLTRAQQNAEISNRVMERQLRDPLMDPEDLSLIKELYDQRGTASSRLDYLIKNNQKIINGRLKDSPKDNRLQVMNLDYLPSFNKYMRSTRNDLALFIDPLGDSSRQAIKDFGFTGAKSLAGPYRRKTFAARGEPSRYNAIEAIAREIRNTETSGGQQAYRYIMDTLIDRVQGSKPMKDFLSETVAHQTKKVAGMMANSPFMKSVAADNPTARKFVQTLKQASENPITESSSSRTGRELTKLLYSSHLGFNLGSASLNLMQPLMFATSSMGPKAMAKGYAEGIRQYMQYVQERLRLGLNADPIKVDELRKKIFRLSNVQMPDGTTSDLLDIRKNAFELLDSEAFAGAAANTKPGFKFFAYELPLKLFTNSEIFNRVVTGEAMIAASKSAGVLKGINQTTKSTVFSGSKPQILRAIDNTRQMVQNTQFGSDLINSPDLLQSTGFGLPLVRQFFSFPIRTLTAWTDTASMINQGRRTWGVTNFTTQGRYTAMAHDLIRMMGSSAILYEAGKNALGIDLSRGLSGQTLYESTIVGPMLVEGKDRVAYHLPVPPAGDIVMDAVEALTSDDVSILGQALPRFVPGGIGLSRLLSMAPRVSAPQGWLGGLQREYADWGQTMNGQVPVYRADGSLLEYRSPAKMILGSLGFNSYMFKNEQELNRFLVKNRQAVIGERRKYLDAVLSNDMGKASQIKANFEKRFKFPLSISKEQVDRAIQLREVPLKERMYQRMSPQARPQIRPFLEERLETLKSRTAQELDLTTAQKARVLPSTFESYDPYQFVTDS